MKFYRRIYINERGFPPDLYEMIVKLKPECQEGDHFRLECLPGDDEAAKLAEVIVSLCEGRGLMRTAGTPGTYGYEVDRIYEPSDLLIPELLLIEGGRPLLHDVKRDEFGGLVLPAAKARASLKLGVTFTGLHIIISDEVRRGLEGANIKGAKYASVAIRGRSSRATNAPFWELLSSVTLPKMTNAVFYEDHPFQCFGIADAPYRRGEVHYRKEDLQALPIFDVAYTFEKLGGPNPSMIISQRFHQHCLKNRIPVKVRPVRID